LRKANPAGAPEPGIVHQRHLPKRTSTEANEDNESDFLLRSLRFLLFQEILTGQVPVFARMLEIVLRRKMTGKMTCKSEEKEKNRENAPRRSWATNQMGNQSLNLNSKRRSNHESKSSNPALAGAGICQPSTLNPPGPRHGF
jgi:hypothetical protein